MDKIDPEDFADLVVTMDGFVNDYFFRDCGELAYHYASFEGACSITSHFNFVSGGSVLYHKIYSKLSDEYEGKDVENCYLKALRKYLYTHTVSEELTKLLKIIEPDNTYILTSGPARNAYHVYRKKCSAYIACFSLDGDSIYMWDNYLKGAKSGIALGYNTINLKSNTEDYFGNGYRHILQKVLYSEQEKVSFIYAFLTELLKRTTDESHIRFYVSNFLNCNRFVFKREEFSEEKEVRSVIFFPKDGRCALNTIENGTFIPFKFDSLNSIDRMVYFSKGNNQKERDDLSRARLTGILKESRFNK